MYNNSYLSNVYSPQPSVDRINAQINELQKMKEQMQQQPPQQPMPTNLTQNFQLAPTNREIIKFAGSIEEVQRDIVIGDTPYFSKDMSIVWVKSTNGDIKTYELNEIIPKDEKDLQIELLMAQLNELKGMMKNEQHDSNDDEQLNETSTTKDDGAIGTTTKKSESTSIQRISTSKKK